MTDKALHLGEMKFFDSKKGFGFVKDYANGADHFVHISNVKSSSLDEGSYVVFQLGISSKKKGSFDAINVTLLSKFKSDPDFLIIQFNSIKDHYCRRAILKSLPEHCINFLVEQALLEETAITNDTEYRAFVEKIKTIQSLFGDVLSRELIIQLISNRANEISGNVYKVPLWLNNIIGTEPDVSLLTEYFIQQSTQAKQSLYRKISASTKVHLYKTYVLTQSFFSSFERHIFFLNLEKQNNQQEEFLALFDEYFKNERLSVEESNKVFELYEVIHPQFSIQLMEATASMLYKYCADFIKTKLWLNDRLVRQDYDTYHANFIFLVGKDQQRYIKKLFYLLKIDTPRISFDNISSLKNLTFNYSDGKKYQLDFTCNVLLETIEKLRSGQFLAEQDIYDVLTRQVEGDLTAILSLTGFFEHCDGRSIPDDVQEMEGDQKSIISLKRLASPRNIDYCEGVRFGGDGNDRIYHHECWWCRGGSCFEANQSLDIPSNYQAYTLSTFLQILAVTFSPKEYFDFLGLINKVNVFLRHLNCRTCGYLLKPRENNYYSYYRISNFVCSNHACEDKSQIYLNHCLGARKTAVKSKCDNLIDSRDVKRCNYDKHHPVDRYEKYGPYICNHCGSCCSQKSLEKKRDELIQRNWNMQPGLEWKVRNKVGHLERGEIFCYKCGLEMASFEEEYNRFVARLENPDDTFTVLRRGTNSYGFWYMVRATEEFFNEARRVGLRVSDTNGNDSAVKFISQGNTNFLVCETCNIRYNKRKVEFVAEDFEAAH